MRETSPQEKEALLQAMSYWIERWDFECPTLFGLEKSDMESVANDWPDSLSANMELALAACLGSLRELLYGASALPKQSIENAIGISYQHASDLCTEIHRGFKNAL